jgi:Leucine Rich repeat
MADLDRGWLDAEQVCGESLDVRKIQELLTPEEAALYQFTVVTYAYGGLDYLKTSNTLTDLDLSNTPLEGAGLANIATLDRVSTLSLKQTTLTQGRFEEFLQAAKLRPLNLSLAGTNLTKENGGDPIAADKWVPCLAALTAVTGLDLSGIDLTDDGLIALRNINNKVATLVLADNKLSDKYLDRLNRFEQLAVLDLGNNKKISDVGVKKIACSRLQLLNLSGTGSSTKAGAVTDHGIRSLLGNNQRTLVTLGLSGTSTIAQGGSTAAIIGGMEYLETLDISGTGIDDARFRTMWLDKNLPSLIWLDISGTGITDKGFFDVEKDKVKVGLPRLTHVRIGSDDTKVTTGGLNRRNAALSQMHLGTFRAKLVKPQ